MAQKISTLILEVDLQCVVCSKKIMKVLGKLQDRENIQSMVYDEKESIVIVSGPFDPKRLSKKLCYKACKVIKDIHIKENKPDNPPPPQLTVPELPPPIHVPEPEPKPKPKPEPTPAPQEPEPPKPDPEPTPQTGPIIAIEPTPEKPEPPTQKPELIYQIQYPYPIPYPYPYPYPMVWPFIPVCGCNGWCKCNSTEEPPAPAPVPSSAQVYAPPYYDGCRTCKFICEEEPSICTIM